MPINYKRVPAQLDYKSSLNAVTDAIVGTSKVQINPTSAGPFRPDGLDHATFYLEDNGSGAVLDPSSVYLTALVKTQGASGDLGSASSKFTSSANCLIKRILVRSKRSRQILCDLDQFGCWSALMDKVTVGESAKSGQMWARGMSKFEDNYQQGSQAAMANNKYGMASHGVDIDTDLRAGLRRFKFELSYLPFFKNRKLIPLVGSGGFEVQIFWNDSSRALIGYHAANGTPASTTTHYLVSDAKLYGTIHYLAPPAAVALNRAIATKGVTIPYLNVSSVSHTVTGSSESIRLASSLENLVAIFAVFRSTADMSAIAKNSISHQSNPLLTEIQYIAGGNVVVPVVPMQCSTNSGQDPTPEVLAELELALQRMPSHASTDNLSIDQFGANLTGNSGMSSASGTEIAANAAPVHNQLAKWDGSYIVGTSFTSRGAFDSVYNRTNSRNAMDQARKSDLHVRLSFHAAPTDCTATFFLMYGNAMTIRAGGQVTPMQATF